MFDSPTHTSSSRRRRRSSSPKSGRSSSRRRRSSSPSSSRRHRRRSRSKSVDAKSPSKKSDGFQYTKGMDGPPTSPSQSSRGFPTFDSRDHAPEDSGKLYSQREGYNTPSSPMSSSKGSSPMVRGSLRLEGVDFSKYEGLKSQPDVQRLFTTALRDDIISEAGNGIVRDDILLKLTPGPIKTVVLDYGDAKGMGGKSSRTAPTLVDAEWSMDVEYAISARSETAQLRIAKALFEALSNSELDVRATRAAYMRYINSHVDNPWKIQATPCSKQNEPAVRYQEPASPQNGSTFYSPPPSRSVFASYDNMPSRGTSSIGSPHSQHSNALSPPRSPGY
eukprot:TRINITY_DN5079_c0_g2_i1.p1 TRINITY_DN5079_c0_g2~~TRINITY_DN5079_c0_g2_i1.p1  ORF type:complete len:350 (+),score=73.78 TRINITY_DN5079_c0_g2_i1:51-1052(+)